MNIDQIRKDILGVESRIHLNNAGSSLPPHSVVTRIIEHLKLEEQCGGYEAQAMVEEEENDFYRQAALLINAESPSEISYLESATHAWQRIFYSIPLKQTDRIIAFENEYASLFLALLQQKKQFGCTIDVIPMNSDGDICLKTLKQKMNDDVKMVLLGHMPTQSGQLSRAEEIGNIVKNYPSFFILDATQTVGQYPVDVQKIACDALCTTGRKFLRGPRGTGFLYVNEKFASLIEPCMIDLRSAYWASALSYRLMEGSARFENWEQSIALKLGLKEALRYANKVGIHNIWQRGQSLANRLRNGLRSLSRVTLCDPGSLLGNIVTFKIDGVPCDKVIAELAKNNISINKSQRDYARLDFEKRNLDEVCRASPHYFNTEAEIDKLLETIKTKIL